MILDYMKGDPSFACPACDTLVYFGSFRLVINNCSIPPYFAISLRTISVYESDKLLFSLICSLSDSTGVTLVMKVV